MSGLRPLPVVALAGWTLLTWLTRLPLAWGDPDLDGTGRVLATVPVAVFVALAVATIAVRWWDPATSSSAAKGPPTALALWTVAYWAVRLPLILIHDHPAGFKAVHAALALVAVGLSVISLRAEGPFSRRARPGPAPAPAGGSGATGSRRGPG